MMAMVTRWRGEPRQSDRDVGGEGRNEKSFAKIIDTHPTEIRKEESPPDTGRAYLVPEVERSRNPFWMHMKGKMEQGELFEQIDHRSSIADALLEEPCTDPYARFCERTAGCGPPPTRSLKVLRHADSARSSWMKTIHVGPSAQPDADRQRSFRPSISTQPYRHRRGLPPTTRRSRAL